MHLYYYNQFTYHLHSTLNSSPFLFLYYLLNTLLYVHTFSFLYIWLLFWLFIIYNTMITIFFFDQVFFPSLALCPWDYFTWKVN